MTALSHSFRFICAHGRLPLRDRYWTRTNGKLRLRYVMAAYMTASALLGFGAMSVMTHLPFAEASMPAPSMAMATQDSPAPHPIIVAQTAQILPAIKPTPPVASDFPPEPRIAIPAPVIPERHMAALITQAQMEPKPRVQHLTIAAGDTLSTLLVQAGLDTAEAHDTINQLRKHVRPSDLRPGQTLDLHLTPTPVGYTFERLSLAVDPIRTIEVEKSASGTYTTELNEKPLIRDTAAQTAIVRTSLYGSAEAAGIPSSVTAEAIKAFAHQFDFQRDIQPGDKMDILYDRMVTDEGYVARTGQMMFARLQADGRDLAIYRFENRDGRVDYYDRDGKSIRKALLRTPMDSIRISSGFGMRKHPILGYSKMHKGVDFAAPTGTPIYAAGDGTIEKAGRFAAYGNYVRIRHTNIMSTAYAHLSRYAPGIRPGSHVRQGQIIGYVGTTGRSTGPHLHYEIIVRGEQVNPQSVKLPTMVVLEGKDRQKFKDHVRKIDAEFKKNSRGQNVATTAETPDTTAPLR